MSDGIIQGDDDFVIHTDILSSPSKNPSLNKKTYRKTAKAKPRTRRGSPSKKSQLEILNIELKSSPSSSRTSSSLLARGESSSTSQPSKNTSLNLTYDDNLLNPRKRNKPIDAPINQPGGKKQKKNKLIKLELSTDNILPERAPRNRRSRVIERFNIDMDSDSESNTGGDSTHGDGDDYVSNSDDSFMENKALEIENNDSDDDSEPNVDIDSYSNDDHKDSKRRETTKLRGLEGLLKQKDLSTTQLKELREQAKITMKKIRQLDKVKKLELKNQIKMEKKELREQKKLKKIELEKQKKLEKLKVKEQKQLIKKELQEEKQRLKEQKQSKKNGGINEDKLLYLTIKPDADTNQKPSKNKKLPDVILEPGTPTKQKMEDDLIPKNFEFVSPLKKMILDNLEQLKAETTSPLLSLTLNKDFVPTPAPTDKNYKPSTKINKGTDFLDTCEGYFDQKKQKKRKISKKSMNSMGMAPEVTREEFALVSNIFSKSFLKKKRDKLFELQQNMFPQYWFEITQGFTLLFYGVGSKREFMERFAIEYLSPKLKQIEMHYVKQLGPPQRIPENKSVSGRNVGVPCIIVNGYNPTCSYRDVYKDITNILLPEELKRSETKYWGNHVMIQITKMIEFYKAQPSNIKLILVVHNLDGPSVRKAAFQTMLSALAMIKQIAIIGSTDHVYAPILWDNMRSQEYNFIFHDVTNYEPYTVESSFQDIMRIGKNESSTGGEGARYVLQSLTVNSRKLFKLLVEAQLAKTESDAKNLSKKIAPTKRSTPNSGVEFKQLGDMCAEEFIASNEISLRTMLREFVEHGMVNISKNLSGTEFVWIPYNYGEIKKLNSTVLPSIS